MKILITGFDPFGGETVNPATEAVKLLQAPEGTVLSRLTDLPTVFGTGDTVCQAILREKPQAVVCVGQAGGRAAVTVERVAINVMDASIEDNRGFCPRDLPVEPGGAAAYFSTLPIRKIVSAIRAAGVPAQISNTAGTFVCNSLLYQVLSFLQRQQLPVKAGFIHVPFLPSQAEAHPGCPGLPLSQMVTALEAALSAIGED